MTLTTARWPEAGGGGRRAVRCPAGAEAPAGLAGQDPTRKDTLTAKGWSRQLQRDLILFGSSFLRIFDVTVGACSSTGKVVRHSAHRHRQAHNDRRPSSFAALDLDRARHSIRCCVARSAGPGRCPSSWWRSTARRRVPAIPRPSRRRCREPEASRSGLSCGCVDGQRSVPGMAWSAFSTMFARLRATSVRSTNTRGSGGAT